MSRHTIGVLGSGVTTPENIDALLSDVADAVKGDLRFILPIAADHFRPGVEAVADWIRANAITYEVVTDGTDDREMHPFLTGASKTHRVQQISRKVVSLLERADGPILMVLWDDENDEVIQAVEQAADLSIRSLDLTHGLDDIQLVEGDDAVTEEPWVPYTRKELEDMPLATLKDIIVKDFEAELPAGRGKDTKIDFILQLQEADDQTPPEAGDAAPAAASNGAGSIDIEALAEMIIDGVVSKMQPMIDTVQDTLEELRSPPQEEEPEPAAVGRRRRR